MDFVDKLAQDRAHFQAFTDEGKLVARIVFQSAVDAADTSSWLMATAIIMHCESWLHTSGFPRDVQNTMDDLFFD